MTDYLIMKRGAYYRPNAQGYTASRREAGRYSKEEAEAHRDSCDPGELTLVEVTEPIAPDVPEDIAKKAREVLDKLAVDWSPATDADDWTHISEAILAERERCAKIAEDAATRARSQKNRKDASSASGVSVLTGYIFAETEATAIAARIREGGDA